MPGLSAVVHTAPGNALALAGWPRWQAGPLRLAVWRPGVEGRGALLCGPAAEVGAASGRAGVLAEARGCQGLEDRALLLGRLWNYQ